jgi:hypothetical protein
LVLARFELLCEVFVIASRLSLRCLKIFGEVGVASSYFECCFEMLG